MAKLISNDGRSFTFEGTAGRVYSVPFRRPLEPRSETARGFDRPEREWGFIINIKYDGHGRPSGQWGTKPKNCSLLDSLEVDYDLSEFIIAGEALVTPRPMRSALVALQTEPASVVDATDDETRALMDKLGLDEAEPAPVVAIEKAPRGVMARAEIAGLSLEAVTAPGDTTPKWVTLRSLFEPFGKRVSEQTARLRTWANLGKFQTTAEPSSGNLPDPAVSCIAWDQALAALLEMPAKGVPDAMLPGLIRFKREGAAALHAYFVDGVAVNPRAQAAEFPEWARNVIEAVGGAARDAKAGVDALEAKKADRSDVEAVVELVAEVGPKAEARAREVAREEIAAAAAAALAGQAPPVAPPPPPSSPGDDSPRGMKALLVAAGLPTEKKPRDPRMFLFGDVALQATRRVLGRGPVAKGTFSLREAEFSAVVATLKKAADEYRRLGWGVDASGNATKGRFKVGTVIEHMIEALRAPSQPFLTIVKDADGTGS